MSTQTYRALFDLSGKTAIVTGALGLLGRRFCRGLAESGAQVAVVDLDADKAQQFASRLAQDYGTRAAGIGCDVSNPAAVDHMIGQTCEVLGDIHILLNNAASKSEHLDAFFAPFEEYSLDEWRRVMSVNLDGAFLTAQAVGRQMIAQGTGGSIIQTSSIYGLLGPDDRIYQDSHYLGTTINTPAVYSASKAAIVGLTNHLAARWAKHGIRVNTLTPGGVESGQNDTFVKNYSNRVPMGRMAKADELVGAALFLASDASSYVTGQNLFVDGGLSAW
ncbi:SDR family oxidoreductase [Alicyclobacillus sp. SO9]|uniref:SDR family oxidoreductase n=1 Tax=Alicyclobacillus sp. SO9 TaxID=2665646 RepID=UPI001E2C0C0A|nr:SDR family oxidoreductase [Alicyclobacillus sp. SO9]